MNFSNKLIILFFLISSCSEKQDRSYIIIKDFSLLSKKGAYLYLDNNKFSGILTDSIENIKILEVQYLNGRKNGYEKIWYNNGKISEERFYKNGRKEGNHKLFWENGNKKMIANFLDGQYEGKMIQWHKNGEKFKEFYYENGNEIGNQKMWNSKGNIKANYDIVNNRRYGLTGQKNCVSSNEIF